MASVSMVAVHFVNEKQTRSDCGSLKFDGDEDRESRGNATQEHQLYPQVLGWLCNGLVQVKDERVWLGDECLPVQGAMPLLK